MRFLIFAILLSGAAKADILEVDYDKRVVTCVTESRETVVYHFDFKNPKSKALYDKMEDVFLTDYGKDVDSAQAKACDRLAFVQTGKIIK